MFTSLRFFYMPCLLALIALGSPRLVLILLWLFSNYLSRAYESTIIPFLGFLFLPLTTLAYAWATNTGRGLEGVGLVVFAIALIMDLGITRFGRKQRKLRKLKRKLARG